MGACLAEHLAETLAGLKATAADPPVRVPARLVERVEEGRMIYALDATCTACSDLGEVPDGSGGWRPCRCVPLRRLAERLTRAQLPAPDGRPLPWEPTPLVPITATQALDVARAELELGDRPATFESRLARSTPGSLLIHGANGTGKTTLAGVLARRWVIGGAVVRYVRWPELLRQLRAAMRDDRYDTEIAALSGPGPQVLVLDEVGADKGSEWVASVAEEVIGVRLERGAVVVVVTNSDPQTTLAHQLGDRTRSRLARVARSLAFGVKPARQAGAGGR